MKGTKLTNSLIQAAKKGVIVATKQTTKPARKVIAEAASRELHNLAQQNVGREFSAYTQASMNHIENFQNTKIKKQDMDKIVQSVFDSANTQPVTNPERPTINLLNAALPPSLRNFNAGGLNVLNNPQISESVDVEKEKAERANAERERVASEREKAAAERERAAAERERAATERERAAAEKEREATEKEKAAAEKEKAAAEKKKPSEGEKAETKEKVNEGDSSGTEDKYTKFAKEATKTTVKVGAAAKLAGKATGADEYVEDNFIKPISKVKDKVGKALIAGTVIGVAIANERALEHRNAYMGIVNQYSQEVPKQENDISANIRDSKREYEIILDNLSSDSDHDFSTLWIEARKSNQTSPVKDTFDSLSNEKQIDRALKAHLLVESDKLVDLRDTDLFMTKGSARVEKKITQVLEKTKKGLNTENPDLTKSQGNFGQFLDNTLYFLGGKETLNAYHVALEVLQGKSLPDLAHDVAQHVSRTSLQKILESSYYHEIRYENDKIIQFAKEEASQHRDVPGIKEIDDIIEFEKNRIFENQQIELEKLKKEKVENWKENFKKAEPTELMVNEGLLNKEPSMEKNEELERNLEEKKKSLTSSQVDLINGIIKVKRMSLEVASGMKIEKERQRINTIYKNRVKEAFLETDLTLSARSVKVEEFIKVGSGKLEPANNVTVTKVEGGKPLGNDRRSL